MVLAGAEPDDGTMAAVMAAPKTMVPIITVIIIPMVANSCFLDGPHFFHPFLPPECWDWLDFHFHREVDRSVLLRWRLVQNWPGRRSLRLFIPA